MAKVQKIKGFADLFPAEAEKYARLEDAARRGDIAVVTPRSSCWMNWCSLK